MLEWHVAVRLDVKLRHILEFSSTNLVASYDPTRVLSASRFI